MKLFKKILYDYTENTLTLIFNDDSKMVGHNLPKSAAFKTMEELDSYEGYKGAMEFGKRYASMFEESVEENQLTHSEIIRRLGDVVKEYFHIYLFKGILPIGIDAYIIDDLINFVRKNQFSEKYMDEKLLYQLIYDYVEKYNKMNDYYNHLIEIVNNDFDSSWIEEIKYYPQVRVLKICKNDATEMCYAITQSAWETFLTVASVGQAYNEFIKGQRSTVTHFGVIPENTAWSGFKFYRISHYADEQMICLYDKDGVGEICVAEGTVHYNDIYDAIFGGVDFSP